MAPDDSMLDLAELPQRPTDPFRHAGLHSSVMDAVAVGCLVVGLYFLVAEANLLFFLALFFAFAFLFQPFHPH